MASSKSKSKSRSKFKKDLRQLVTLLVATVLLSLGLWWVTGSNSSNSSRANFYLVGSVIRHIPERKTMNVTVDHMTARVGAEYRGKEIPLLYDDTAKLSGTFEPKTRVSARGFIDNRTFYAEKIVAITE